MMNWLPRAFWAALVIVVAVVNFEALWATEVPRMAKEKVKSMLGNPNLIIVDVRQPHDWESSDSKIPGAYWEDPRNVDAWAEDYPKDQTLLFY